MTHTLVTFIGRTRRRENGYPKGKYLFPDGHKETRAFFGFPLRDWLGADRMVILGTSGSMWDHLFEGDVGIEGAEDEQLALVDAVDNKQVQQPQLDALAPRLAAVLGCQVQLQLIPDAFKPEGQTKMVAMLAQAAEGASKLSLDITHSYRHLPMLTLTAALYLRFLRPDLEINGPWYGAFDPEAGEGPVLKLDGLLETADWLSALQRHEWLGDYNGIADQIQTSDKELADRLRSASFKESIHRAQQARSDIKTARDRLAKLPLTGPGNLFRTDLEQRMSWVDEQSLYLRQRRHTLDALKRGDHLRAALYGFEAFITRLARDEPTINAGDINDHEARKHTKESFEEREKAVKPARNRSPDWKQYVILRDLRNVLAHGNQAHGEAQMAIASPDKLHASLQACFKQLLPDESP